MKTTITKKSALFGPKLKFTIVVGAKIRPYCTPKNSQKGVVRLGVEEALKRRLRSNDFAWKTVN
jgi:hypothetical protein